MAFNMTFEEMEMDVVMVLEASIAEEVFGRLQTEVD
jgi:hypothetical protein